MKLKIFTILVFISLIPFISVGQSLLFEEKPGKTISTADNIPFGQTLLIFDSDLDLNFESSMEPLATPVRLGSLYKLLVKQRKCIITVSDTANAEKAYVQFGQLTNSEFNFPTLNAGDRKYFKVRQVTNLHVFDTTDEEKKKVNDNQMNFEKEALLIINYEPVDLQLQFVSTELTDWKKEKGRHRLYVKPVPQVITIKAQGLDDTKIVIDKLSVKEVKYFFVSLPYFKPKFNPT